MGGPLLLVPFSSTIGRCSLIFWCLLGSLACNIWGPLMTQSDEYIPFVMSRLLAGMFGSVPTVLAGGFIMAIYFLHQRGRAFAVLEVCILAGFAVCPVFAGFIADTRPWPFVFWWFVPVTGVTIILGK